MDNFKPLNDKHGHAVGDLLLVEVARRLKACVREIDTVARTGGDEFVLVIGELDAEKAVATARASAIAAKVRTSLSEPYLLKASRMGTPDMTVEHCCTASIGVVVFKSGEARQDDILKWADTAMYQAKDAGRNAIYFYDGNRA